MSLRPEASEERVLVLAPTGRDANLTGSVLADAQIASLLCSDAQMLVDELSDGGASALLLAEEALTERTVPILLRALADQPAWSDVPLVLIASEASPARSNRRTLEIVEVLGHVTLLDRPVRLISLLSAVRVAIGARRRQYQARDLLVRLQEGVEQRDRFLAMLGHELRNPLTAITYAAALLPANTPSRSREVIERQSRHLARMVDELLDVARVTTNKISLHRDAVNLRALVAGCVESVRLGNRGVTIECDVAPVEVQVNADAVRIEQVVTNLLVNALKYTPSGGLVRVSVQRGEGSALVSIEDNGVGIPAEMLPRVFDLFVQVDGSLDRACGGLGIGLTVVRGIVELHGGSVRASSAGLGQGTRFDVSLPLASFAGAEPQAAVPVEEEGDAVRGRHVLIVEDDEDIRDTLQEALENEGHVVDAAPDGASALARASADVPDVALVDIGLPGMTGYEIARALRRAFGDRIYLAAMTGYGLPEDRERARDAGFDTHLTKPVDLRSVERLIRNAPGRAERSL